MKNISPEVQQLADEVGEFIKSWGFKKIHGRIWTHLFLSDEALSAKDVMKSLDISKALFSITINELLEYEMVTASGFADDGSRLYVANGDVNQVIFNVLKHRELKMIAKIAKCHKLVESLSPAQKTRLGLSVEKISFFGDLLKFLSFRFGGRSA